ncbi:GDSL-type esterase/lipase family protein [Blautia stercoris]|jgi:lysophospholipase L1-like esterase|nr:GDSL-type esterase/lipase family protein [Blautia stercoris]
MKEILCFGDSNTYGLIPKTNGRYDREVRWTGLLQDALKNDGFHVLEEGLCGRTTVFEDEFRQNRKGSDMLPVLLESHNPINIVVLMLGTNDCKSYYHASAEVIGKGIEKLIEQIWNYSQSVKILLVSPILLGQEVWKNEFDPEFDTDSIETSKQLKAVYERIAKKQKIEFLAASDYAKPSKEDQEHMSVEGHRRLAEAVIEKIKNSELSA